ncbi:MAG: hypothetical protein K0S01_1652 [Herbinix sp.]|jgi:hypothetical protein|nr:hypothetical protein [Herbinix sp.]
MDRDYRIVAFVGIDKQEYILYLSRILYLLGKKVLMVDCSETGALTASIPTPVGTINSIIENRGVMFLDARSLNKDNSLCWEEVSTDEVYNYILIDYGYNTHAEGLNDCDQLVIVTDQQAHNIGRLSIPAHLKDKDKILIITNVVACKITPQFITNELKLNHLVTKKVYVVNQDELDMECKIKCQYEGIFRFIKLSTQLKSVLKGLIMELLPELQKKILKEAYKKAERGV